MKMIIKATMACAIYWLFACLGDERTGRYTAIAFFAASVMLPYVIAVIVYMVNGLGSKQREFKGTYYLVSMTDGVPTSLKTREHRQLETAAFFWWLHRTYNIGREISFERKGIIIDRRYSSVVFKKSNSTASLVLFDLAK